MAADAGDGTMIGALSGVAGAMLFKVAGVITWTGAVEALLIGGISASGGALTMWAIRKLRKLTTKNRDEKNKKS